MFYIYPSSEHSYVRRLAQNVSKHLSVLELRNEHPPPMCLPHPKEKFTLPGPVVVYVEDRSADPGVGTPRVGGSYFDRLWHHGKQHSRCCLSLRKSGEGVGAGAGAGAGSRQPRVVQFPAQKAGALAVLEPMIDSADAFNARMKRQRQKYQLFGEKKKRFKISHY